MAEEQPSSPGTSGEGIGFAFDLPDDRRSSPGGFLLDTVRRRPLGRALLSGLTFLLFVGGAGMFAYPLFTDVYTEQVIQGRLQDEFVRTEVATVDEWQASVKGQTGKALTRIAIPDLDVETLVVEGTSPAALRAGAGHYPNTPLPGEIGNVAIAGHRTTYGRPFNRLDELAIGAEIWLSTPVGDHLYRVTGVPTEGDCKPAKDGFGACITHPQDWGVVAPTSDAVLTLTTCHPKGSAAQRLVIRAELVSSEPPGTYEAQRDA
jgi:sortase A